MMGMVFDEFFSYVTEEYSEDMVDDIIIDSKLDNDGAYTAVGRYDPSELINLVVALSERTKAPVENIVKGFGFFVFPKLYLSHKQYLPDWQSPFEVFRKIDNHIHIEVQKFYPNAELPSFSVEKDTENEMTLFYSSARPLATFAEGIIQGCIAHFNANMAVHHEQLGQNGKYFQSRFTITKEAA